MTNNAFLFLKSRSRACQKNFPFLDPFKRWDTTTVCHLPLISDGCKGFFCGIVVGTSWYFVPIIERFSLGEPTISDCGGRQFIYYVSNNLYKLFCKKIIHIVYILHIRRCYVCDITCISMLRNIKSKSRYIVLKKKRSNSSIQ